MEQIKVGKVKPLAPEERDKLECEYQIGKYRPFEINWEHAKQLAKEQREDYIKVMSEAHSKRAANMNRGYVKSGQGKRQKEAEFERLKHEIENG